MIYIYQTCSATLEASGLLVVSAKTEEKAREYIADKDFESDLNWQTVRITKDSCNIAGDCKHQKVEFEGTVHFYLKHTIDCAYEQEGVIADAFHSGD